MSSRAREWQIRPLGDLCARDRIITYGIVKVGDYVPGGVPVIRGGDIRRNRVVFDDEKRVSEAVSNQFQRTILRGGELVLNLIAEPGHCAVVPDAMRGFNVSRDVAVIPLGPGVDHRFVNYALQSPQVVSWLKSRLQGSVTQKINLSTLREVPLSLPSTLEAQTAIADVLASLDDKIEANARLAALADGTWQAILGAARATASTQDGDSAPRLQPLSSLARFVNGRAFTKDATGTGRMVVRIAELNSGPGASTVYNEIDVHGDNLARPGDLLFAWSGSLIVVRWSRPEAIVNQHIFKVLPVDGVPIWFVHGCLLDLLPFFRAVAAGKATTMGHIQRQHLDELTWVPSRERLSELDTKCAPLWETALSCERENLVLGALREVLLPKLISGDVTVRDPDSALRTAL